MRKQVTIFAVAAAIASTSVFFTNLRATGGFTLGNLVVYRVGDGSASLGSAATAVFLDEYTPTGTLVQSIPMPTTVNGSQKRLTASGSATTEGFLTQSADGRYIVLAGYDAAPGTASVAGTPSSGVGAVSRVIGRVDAAGVVDTSTATTAISGGNPRGVASDGGINFWIAGSNTGVQWATFGNSAVTTISTTQTNLREANIFGGQLYLSTGAGSAYRIGAVGSGLPTTSGQTTTSLPGLPTSTGSSNGFFFADLSAAVNGLDTLYVADDGVSQLQKYSLVAGSWVSNGNIPVTSARGLTATVQGATVTLFGTSGSTGATLYTFTDASGYNAAISGTTTTIATSLANRAFRGVAFTPTNSTPPPPPTPTNPTGVGAASPSPVQAGNSTTLTVTVTPGANPTSTLLAVTADLSAIGGSAAQAFPGAGNTFSFTATVPAGTSTGAKSIPVSIADAQGRTGSATISLSVSAASTSPTGVATATPASLRVENSTLLTVTVSPGANPPSGELAVTGNLSAIGGSASQQFYDDGTHGDAVAGNNVFSFQAFVPAGTSTGAKSLPITVSDTQARSTTTSLLVSVKPPPPPTTIKISQVYGGGGNSGATYTNDFVELFNIGSTAVDITGWSVQYSSSGASLWSGGGGGNVSSLCPAGPCFIEPGHYFLVQEGAGAGGTTPLPAADVSGTIALAAGAAKVALVATTDPLIGACPVDDNIVDFVGYGGANCAETTPAGSLSNTSASLRRGNGCIDTNNNANDFVTVGPIPRNSAAPQNICGGNPSVPSGVGIAVPTSIEPAAEVLLTVQVTGAVTPPSTALAVTADLAAVGGPSAQSFYDDGTHGDITAGDGTFSFLALMPASSTTGAKNIVATIYDAQARMATAPITLTIVSPTCGVERWSVKVGTDGTVGLVNLTPRTPATIEALTLITPPLESEIADGGIFASARSAPVETTVYTIDAMMTFYKKETDVDYHIVLDDGNQHTLISEIPSPACVITSGTPRVLVPSPLAEGIARARAKFDARLSATSFFQNAGIPVRITGVGFFDFEHGQTGVAPNAIELHPVLDISFRGNTSTALMSNENPSVFGDTVQLTATVTGGDGDIVPTGNVVFFDSGNSFTAVLNASGQATYTTNLLGAGTHTITAAYEGDDTSVPSTSAPFLEVVAKAGQTIDFAALAGRTYGDPDFVISGGASSGLPVGFTIVSGPATMSGGTIHITGAGSVTVRASQPGDDNYNPATDVDQVFVVAPAGQTIAFGSLPDKTLGDGDFTVSGSASSGLPVTFAIASGPASISGDAVHITGAGVVTVRASQAGDANYSGALDVVRSFTVSEATGLVYSGPSSVFTGPVTLTATLHDTPGGAPVPGEPIVFTIGSNTVPAATNALGVATATLALGAGTYPVSASFAGDPASFRLASSASASLVVMNRPPVASADSAATLENIPVTIPVLANDGDPDGGVLSVASVTAPAHGTAAAGGGGIVYQPAANFFGTDTFSYSVSDGQGGSATAQVTVTVSRAGRFVAFSRDFTFLGDKAVVHSGDVGANTARAHDHDHDRDNRLDHDDVTVWIDEGASIERPDSRVLGDAVQLDRAASVYDLWANGVIEHRATVLGTRMASLALPVVTLPAFPVVTPGTESVTVNGGTRILAPGSYGRVTVKGRGTLVLTGGLYQMLSLDLEGQTTVIAQGPVELRVKEDLDGDNRARFVVDPSIPGLRASQLVVYVEGADADAHHRFSEDHAPTIVEFGEQSVIQANIYAPSGTIRLGNGSDATGAFIGRHVRVGDRGQLTLDSAFK